jgi:hypothetical protein
MELTQTQYELLKDTISRYRLTIEHRFKVFNDNDVTIAETLNRDLGIQVNLPTCMGCDGMAWAKAMFGELDKKFTQYGAKNS